MGIEQRRHERFAVHLTVSYEHAAEFVSEYVDNLSMGGLFIANATQLAPLQEITVEIRLPGHGEWRVAARAVFIVDAAMAAKQNRKPGAGMEITRKPPGFEEALHAYLLRLGKRRDVAVMVGELPGASAISAAGYRTVPLGELDEFADTIARSLLKVIGVVVAPDQSFIYRAAARGAGLGEIVFPISHPAQVPELITRLDALL